MKYINLSVPERKMHHLGDVYFTAQEKHTFKYPTCISLNSFGGIKILNLKRLRFINFSFVILLVSISSVFAASAGPNNPRTAVNDSSIGTVAWTNPKNVNKYHFEEFIRRFKESV